jgi:hypothetical protein
MINNNLFWDIDINDLNLDKHVRFIIERVLTKGDLNDWFEMKKIYGLNRIKQEVIQIRYLDKKTLNLLSLFFHIPKEDFRCYKTKPYPPEFWNY